MKTKKWFLLLVVALVAGGTAWWALKRGKHEEMVAKYETVKVARGNIEVTVQSTATVRPQNRLEIKPPIAGRVDEVLVREGDSVAAGQIIGWMSSTDRAALLDAARARGPAELEHWKEIYKATPIVAPLDGTIIARDAEPGQTVTAQDTLLVMSDVLVVEAQVDETDLAQIALGQSVVVALDAYPERSFSATVSHIAYESETVNNVTIYKVEVLPDKMPEFVRSGMTANVTFTAQAASGVLVLPAEAVHDEEGRQVVWVPGPAGNGGRSSRPVELGLSDGKHYELKDGLAEGDLVLVPRVQEPITSGGTKSNPFMPFGGPGAPRRSSR